MNRYSFGLFWDEMAGIVAQICYFGRDNFQFWLVSILWSRMWLAWKELVFLNHLTNDIWIIFVKSVSTSLSSHLR